ncbi:glycosyltransferase family 2 protein [Aeromonas hydrophila]|uniref:glycosyltransferase family 2 protein n=1 Tax=Aeromonas hydrophila TaxID=644 RepID=UPI003EB64CBD
MKTESSYSVVIVFYNPEDEHIRNSKKLSEGVDLVIIDNSPHPREYNIESAHIIKLNENKGIAAAINIGLQYSVNKGYKYSLILDQDSNPSINDLDKLVGKISALNRERLNKVAAVSPAYYDRAINKRCDFIVVNGNSISRVPSIGTDPIDVSYTITSGTVIKLDVLNIVGFMDESLFIDFVDIEWCFRVVSKGYQIVGIPDVLMEHEIGCKPIRIFGRTYVNHSSIRHYYYFRNALLLMSRDYVPRAWKINEILKIVPRFFVYALFTDNRLAHCEKMLRGIYDGVRGKSGGF